MKLTHDSIERNVGLLVILTVLVISVGGLLEIVPLFFQKSTTTPVEGLIPMPEEIHEVYLTLRRKDLRTIVTVIELLSPTNKRPGANGFDQYLEKRLHVLASFSNLVELDLLRGGRRPPWVGQLPPGDFLATVARLPRRPRAEAYVWSLEQRFPIIPIPLADADPDVLLDLQEVFNLVYDRAGYDYSLDYHAPLDPPLDQARAAWVQRVLHGL